MVRHIRSVAVLGLLAITSAAQARPHFRTMDGIYHDFQGLGQFAFALSDVDPFLLISAPRSGGQSPRMFAQRTDIDMAPPVPLIQAPPIRPGAIIESGVVDATGLNIFAYECEIGAGAGQRGVHRILVTGPFIENWQQQTIPIQPAITPTGNPVIGSDGTVRMLGRALSGLLLVLEAPLGAPQFNVFSTNLQLPNIQIDELCIDARQSPAGFEIEYLAARLALPSGEQDIMTLDLPIGAAPAVTGGPYSPGAVAALSAQSGYVFTMCNSTSTMAWKRAKEFDVFIRPLEMPTEWRFVDSQPVAGMKGVVDAPIAFVGDATPELINSFSQVQFVAQRASMRGAPAGSDKSIAVGLHDGVMIVLETPRTGSFLNGLEIIDMEWATAAVNRAGDIAFVAAHPDGSARFYVMPGIRTSCPGDSNGSFTVDFADITRTLAAWGVEAPVGAFPPAGDANFDHRVDFGDFAAILASFGNDCR